MEKKPSLNIVGAWTKAGVASCVHVKGPGKGDDILLDCGVCDAATFSARAVLVTHGHIDHAGCCINHARGVSLSNKCPTYYVPPIIHEPLITALRAYEVMNDSSIPMNIQPVNTNEGGGFTTFYVTPNVFVRPFQTMHRVPSIGYALYTIQKGKLLPEYVGLPSEEIAKLRQSNVSIKSPDTEQLELVYSGDTLFEAFLQPENAFVFEAPILIVELTYLDGKREKAIDRTHVHLQDIIENADRFHNQQIVFVHLSQKYSASMALEILRTQLPASLVDRSFVNLSLFGVSSEYITPVNDQRRWRQRQRTEAGWGWSHPSTRYFRQQQHQQQVASQTAQQDQPQPSPVTPTSQEFPLDSSHRFRSNVDIRFSHNNNTRNSTEASNDPVNGIISVEGPTSSSSSAHSNNHVRRNHSYYRNTNIGNRNSGNSHGNDSSHNRRYHNHRRQSETSSI